MLYFVFVQESFQDFWEHHKIKPGDILTFRKDETEPFTIYLKIYTDSEACEDLLIQKSKNKATRATDTGRNELPSKRPRRSVAQKSVTNDTKWIEHSNGTVTKMIHLLHISKMRVEIPDWLAKKVSHQP